MASLDIRVKGLREAIEKLSGFPSWHRPAVRDALRTLGREMKRTAESIVKVKTGKLKRSIFWRVVGMVLHFGAAAHYAGYVEHGTRPHIIRPRRAKVLRFEVYGRPEVITRRGRKVRIHRGRRGRFARARQVVFAMFAKHLGTTAQPFIGPAVEMTKYILPELIKKKLKRWFES